MFKTRHQTAPQNATKKGLRAKMLQILMTAAVFYVAVVVFMYVLQRNFLYYPSSYVPTRAEAGVASMEELRFTTEDGLELFAWVQDPADADKPYVVIFHGNAGTLASRGFKARAFLDAGYGAMLVEYRGYGGNPGSPTEQGLFADARAALGALAARRENRGLVLYGESLGTGVAVAMAEEQARTGNPIQALVLEAPFTSTVDVAVKHYPFLPVRKLMKDAFDSQSRIADVQTPLLIVHGARDRTVPQSLGRTLFEAALEPKEALWPPEAGHNDLYDHGMAEDVLAFLKNHNI